MHKALGIILFSAKSRLAQNTLPGESLLPAFYLVQRLWHKALMVQAVVLLPMWRVLTKAVLCTTLYF